MVASVEIVSSVSMTSTTERAGSSGSSTEM